MRVNAVQIPDVIELMERWIATRSACHFIAFTGMHGITETQYDPSFKQISTQPIWWSRMACPWCGWAAGAVSTCAGASMGRN